MVKTLTKHIKEHLVLYSILLFFGLIYSSISLVNHYLMRTAALDLGMFNHALYCFAHFKANYFTLDIIGREINYFGDHFSPITVLFAPFYYLFGGYTLLIIQILSVLFGGIGVFKLAKAKFTSQIVIYLVVIQFLSIFGIFSALAYDFHNNVIAAMLVPWFVYHNQKGNLKWQLFYFVLILITKENMSLWMAFILFGLAIINRSKGWKNVFKWEILLAVISLVYFYLVVSVIMPAIAGTETTEQLFRYNHLGDSMGEILGRAFTEPKYFFALLFEDPFGEKFNFGIKSELHFMVLVSGGLFFLKRPVYFLMLLPIYAQKLLSGIVSVWGMSGQYAVEFAPILSLAIIAALSEVKNKKTQLLYVILITISTIVFNIDSIEKRYTHWHSRSKTAFYDVKHYKTPIDVKEVKARLKLIPEEAVVTSSTELSPYLAFREKIYHYPIVKDAEYIALLKQNASTYPLNTEDFQVKIKELRNDSIYSILYEGKDLIIFKK